MLSPRLAEHKDHLKLRWWRGCIRGARVVSTVDEQPTLEVLDALYADPHAIVLRSLSLGSHVELCLKTRSERVRELRLTPEAPCELLLDRSFPNLDLFELEQGSNVHHLAHARLTKLDASSCPALRQGRFALPSLSEFYTNSDPLRLFEPGGLLADPPAPLSKLGLLIVSPDAVRALRESRLCTQLHELHFMIDQDNLDELLLDPTPFREIELDLYGSVDTREQRDAVAARVASVFPRAHIDLRVPVRT